MVYHIRHQFFRRWIFPRKRRIFGWNQKRLILKLQCVHIVRRSSLQNPRNPDRLLIVGLNERACNFNPISRL